MGTASTKLDSLVRLRRRAAALSSSGSMPSNAFYNVTNNGKSDTGNIKAKSVPSTVVTLVSINPLYNDNNASGDCGDTASGGSSSSSSSVDQRDDNNNDRSSSSSASSSGDTNTNSNTNTNPDTKSIPTPPPLPPQAHTLPPATTNVKSFEDVMALLNADGWWQAGIMIACLLSCVALSISNYAQGIFFVGKLERTCTEFSQAGGAFSYNEKILPPIIDPIVAKLAPSLDNNVAVLVQYGTANKNNNTVAVAEDSDADITCVAPSGGGKCRAWNYSSPYYGYTMQNEWNLVCEQAYKIPLFQSSYLLGYMVGMPLFGAIADIYGRRMVILIAWPILMASYVATAFAPAYWLVASMRALQGLLSGGDWKAKYVLTMEVTSIGRRNMMSVLLGSCFPIAAIIATFMAYYIRDWRMLQLVCIIPAILSCPLLFYIPESPRWLITHSHYDAAKEVLKRGAQINRRKLPIGLDLKTLHDLHGQDDSELKSPLSHFRALFTGAEMRKRSCILCIQWFVAELVFNGVMFYGTGVVPGDPYITLVAMSVFRLFNNPVQIFVFNRFGVRNSHIVLLLLTAIALGTMGALPASWTSSSATWMTFVTLALLVLGNSFIDACVGALDILTTELYPTSLRQTGFGVCSMWAQVGAGISPFIADMLAAHVWRPLPAIVFSALCIIAAFVVLIWLPTFENTALPDTIHDAEQTAVVAAAASATAELTTDKTNTANNNSKVLLTTTVIADGDDSEKIDDVESKRC